MEKLDEISGVCSQICTKNPLVLASDSSEKNLLFVRDLYNLKLVEGSAELPEFKDNSNHLFGLKFCSREPSLGSWRSQTNAEVRELHVNRSNLPTVTDLLSAAAAAAPPVAALRRRVSTVEQVFTWE